MGLITLRGLEEAPHIVFYMCSRVKGFEKCYMQQNRPQKIFITQEPDFFKQEIMEKLEKWKKKCEPLNLKKMQECKHYTAITKVMQALEKGDPIHISIDDKYPLIRINVAGVTEDIWFEYDMRINEKKVESIDLIMTIITKRKKRMFREESITVYDTIFDDNEELIQLYYNLFKYVYGTLTRMTDLSLITIKTGIRELEAKVDGLIKINDTYKLDEKIINRIIEMRIDMYKMIKIKTIIKHYDEISSNLKELFNWLNIILFLYLSLLKDILQSHKNWDIAKLEAKFKTTLATPHFPKIAIGLIQSKVIKVEDVDTLIITSQEDNTMTINICYKQKCTEATEPHIQMIVELGDEY